METLSTELYSKILNGGLFASLDRMRLTDAGGDVQWQCHIAMNNAHYVLQMHDKYKGNHRDGRKRLCFLICAHYLTYIPYGEVGYAVAEAIVRKAGRYETLADFRLEWLRRLMREDYALVTPEGEACIREFFATYRKERYDLSSEMEVAQLFCRGYAAVEAHYGAYAYTMRTQNEEFSKSIFERYWTDEATLSQEDLLAAVRPAPTLDDGDMAFLRSVLEQ